MRSCGIPHAFRSSIRQLGLPWRFNHGLHTRCWLGFEARENRFVGMSRGAKMAVQETAVAGLSGNHTLQGWRHSCHHFLPSTRGQARGLGCVRRGNRSLALLCLLRSRFGLEGLNPYARGLSALARQNIPQILVVSRRLEVKTVRPRLHSQEPCSRSFAAAHEKVGPSNFRDDACELGSCSATEIVSRTCK